MPYSALRSCHKGAWGLTGGSTRMNSTYLYSTSVDPRRCWSVEVNGDQSNRHIGTFTALDLLLDFKQQRMRTSVDPRLQCHGCQADLRTAIFEDYGSLAGRRSG